MPLTDEELIEAIRSVIAANYPGYYIDTVAACVRAIREAERTALNE